MLISREYYDGLCRKVGVCLIYEEYGKEESDDGYSRYGQDLKNEFQIEIDEVDVFPGASLPAFFTDIVLPVAPWLVAVFMSAKPVRENMEVWSDWAGMIKRFFRREVCLTRDAAAIIAVDAVINDMGGLPKSIQLTRYYMSDVRFDEDTSDRDATGVQDHVDMEHLSVSSHVFHITSDGVDFIVKIHGSNTDLKRV